MFTNLKIIWLLVCLTAAFSGYTQSLSGKVVDSETSEPVPFATVHLLEIQSGTFTDENGRFAFEQNLSKLVKIKVTAIGYQSHIEQVTLPVDTLLILSITPKHVDLDEVVVLPSTGILQKHVISNVASRSIKELNTISRPNLGEAISNIPGVYQQSTGQGISKPVIRGLSGMKVVTYLNGLRIENQQFSADHGMGVSEIGVRNVEVIKGPSSLLYGADALGGVVYFSDEYYANQNSTEGYVRTRFETSTMQTKSFVGYKQSKGNLRYNIFGNYTNGADYMLPNQQFVKNSRYSSVNLKGALGYNKENWLLNIRYNLMYNENGIPGHTHDSIIIPELFKTNQQERGFVTPGQKIFNNFLLTENIFYFKNSDLKVLLGMTNNNLEEFEEKITIPNTSMVLNNYTYNVKYHTPLGEHSDLIFGGQGMFQFNRNNPSALDTLIPDANFIDNGLYTLFHSDIKQWELQTGVRVDNRTIRTLNSFEGNSPIERSFYGFNYSLGIARPLGEFLIRANVSTGFRPPHISELLSDGPHHGTLRYEVGNANLTSERATQFDFSTEYNTDHLSIVLNPFYNRIRNYIYIEPQGTLQEGYPLFHYTQTNLAELAGVDFGVHYHPHFAHHFHLEHNISYIYAQDDNGNALPLIPQTRFNTFLRYEFDGEKKWHFENIALQHAYYLAQDRVTTYETATPGYQIVNLGVNMVADYPQPLTISFGVRNLLNERYVDHLSTLKNIGVNAPGISFYIDVKKTFSKTNKQP